MFGEIGIANIKRKLIWLNKGLRKFVALNMERSVLLLVIALSVDKFLGHNDWLADSGKKCLKIVNPYQGTTDFGMCE